MPPAKTKTPMPKMREGREKDLLRGDSLLSAMSGGTVQLPVQTRQAEMRALPADGAEGPLRAELTWTTGAPVRRYDYYEGRYYWEELSLDPKHVRMDRLKNRAPLLANHRAYGGLDDVIGVVESADIDGKKGTATVMFSSREDLAGVRQDVSDGVLSKISHAYRIYAYEVQENGPEGLPVYRAVDWEPLELSVVTIAADDAANVTATMGRSGDLASADLFPCIITRAAKQEEHPMPPKEVVDAGKAPANKEAAEETRDDSQTLAQPKVDKPKDAETGDDRDAEERAVKAERKRAAAITDAGRKLRIKQEEIDKAISDGVSLDAARERFIDKAAELAGDVPAQRSHVSIGQDETQTRREAMVGFLLHRGQRDRYELPEAAQDFRRANFLRIAEICLEWRGERHGNLSKNELVQRALTGTDLPYIVENAVEKALLDHYNEYQPTFLPFCRRVDLPDFKEVSRVGLTEISTLTKHKDGAETSRGNLADEKEKWSLDEYRGMLQITRQTIINDDMDAFSRIPMMFADAARRMESDVVWALITGNPLMADGNNLFDATNHSNYNASGTALAHASMGAAMAAMRKQKGRGKKATIDVRAQFLLIPVALEHSADQLLADATYVLSSDRSQIKTGKVGQLTAIADPRLDEVDLNDWYLAASPGNIDTIEYGTLEGTSGPDVISQVNFETGGMDIKAVEDFGAKVIDHRGFYKQAGA